MQQNQNIVNPDLVCQQAIQARLNVFHGKEQFEIAIAQYNREIDCLINLVNLMKNRILELEQEKGKNDKKEAQNGK